MPEEKQYYSLITNVGLEKLAKATHDGTKINITKYALGDGNGEYVPVTADMTSLVNQCYESDIQGYEIDKEDTNQIIIRCLVPSEIGYFVLREWGLFDDEGDLIAVANTSDTELVPYSSGELLNLYLRIYIQFGNLETVNIVAESASEEIIEQNVLKFVEEIISPFDERIQSLDDKVGTFEESIQDLEDNARFLIPSGTQLDDGSADLNSTKFLEKGNYYCPMASTAQSMSNCPTTHGFMMEVLLPLSASSYVVRIITDSVGDQFVQNANNKTGSYTYSEWESYARQSTVSAIESQLDGLATLLEENI